jgi:Tfp pilus assembly protein FimT
MKRPNGFTLIELLLVLFVIITAAAVLLSIGLCRNKIATESNKKATKPLSRFVVQVQELDFNLSVARLVYIRDTETGQEWLAVRDHSLTPITSSATAQSLKCEADSK